MIVYPTGYVFKKGSFVKKESKKRTKSFSDVLRTHLSRVEKECKIIIGLLAKVERTDLVKETNNQLVSFINLRNKILNEMKEK